MPAKRSRTLRWRECLQEIHERGGAIDIAIARSRDDDAGSQLLWRVSVLGLSASEIVVEEPATMGTPIKLRDGVELVGIMSIGQNRWTFRTENLGRTQASLNAHRQVRAYRLAMPEQVTRCQRRDFYRLAVAGLELPDVRLWPLNDPASVVLAERAIDQASRAALQGGVAKVPDLEDERIRPDLGPEIAGTILNIGGGGVGLRIPQEHTSVLNHHRVFWMRLDMPGALTMPILATAKLAHTHLQNDHSTYAGLSFDFSHNKDHQKLVVEDICRFVVVQQRAQLQRRYEGDGEEHEQQEPGRDQGPEAETLSDAA